MLTEIDIKAIEKEAAKYSYKYGDCSAYWLVTKVITAERIKAKKLLDALEEIKIQTDEDFTAKAARKAIAEYNKPHKTQNQ